MIPATHSDDPGEAWRKLLDEPGQYEHHCRSRSELRRIARLGFAWRRILRTARVRPPARMFELGCGGGIHLAALAANGFDVHGVDVAPAVVARAQQYLAEVQTFQPIRATVEQANFLEYDTGPRSESFDLCFHFGVVEHFLDPEQRRLIWEKMAALTRPGGWVVSVVPCGMHFLRQRLREHRLLGYNIPEIDYGCELHSEEFARAGLRDIVCLPHNYLGFLGAHPSPLISKYGRSPLHVGANLVGPVLPLSPRWKERAAASLIVLGRKGQGR